MVTNILIYFLHQAKNPNGNQYLIVSVLHYRAQTYTNKKPTIPTPRRPTRTCVRHSKEVEVKRGASIELEWLLHH